MTIVSEIVEKSRFNAESEPKYLGWPIVSNF